MQYYSQHGEDKIVDQLGLINSDSIILDIGANDGITYSNSKFFIDKYNCKSYLVEPTNECVCKLTDLWGTNKNVEIIPYAISSINGLVKMNVGNLADTETCVNQVSTLKDEEKNYWESNRGVQYTDEFVYSITPEDLIKETGNKIDLLSIDCEGLDFYILSKIIEFGIKPQIIIFEWNSNHSVFAKCRELLESEYDLIFNHPVNLIFKKL